jgi:DNA-binding transcriptional ArsR family regulator
MQLSPFALRFLEASRTGAAGDWNKLLRDLEAELRARRSYNFSQDALEWSQLKTLRDLTERLAGFRSADLDSILSAREHGVAIVTLLAQQESQGFSRTAFALVQTTLSLKKANLSMQLGYLEDNDIVRRQKQGRSTWIELSPSARKYAIAQGWLAASEVLTPTQNTFSQSKLREPLPSPRLIWSGPSPK